jgi:Icc-related predicted phosphoesterase
MRCLVVADLHYSLPQFDWLVSAAPHFDVVIIAGDALDIGSVVDFRAQIVVVRKYLAMLSRLTRVILCSGNHDLDERDEAGEKVSRWIGHVDDLGIAHDGDSLTIGNTHFTVCPWWDGPRVKEQIGKQLESAANDPHSERWIWIHHAPAANSPTSWGGARYFGDAELVQWIESYKPDMVLSGHVHQSPFVKDGSWFDRLGDTWVFNVGQQFGRPPAHIMLDLDDEKAYWFSAAGEQSINLGQPLQRPAENIEAFPEWLTAVSRAAAQAAGPIPEIQRPETG